MVILANSCVALLERCLGLRGEQEFGSRFQDAVAVALQSLDEYRGCYSNPGAGQPDIIAGTTGFEVKSTRSDAVNLSGNYQAIRGQYPHFRLVGLRTDVKPHPLWVIRMPDNPPTRVRFERVLATGLQSDTDVEARLASLFEATLNVNLHYNASETARPNAIYSDRGEGFVQSVTGAALDLKLMRSALGAAPGYAQARYAGRVDDRSAGADRHIAVAITGARSVTEPVVIRSLRISGATA